MRDQILGLSNDMTVLEQARKHHGVSEQQYRELSQTLPEPILTQDHHGCAAFIDRAAERLLGF